MYLRRLAYSFSGLGLVASAGELPVTVTAHAYDMTSQITQLGQLPNVR